MKKSLAEAYELSYLCPLCQYIDKDEDDVVQHMVDEHSDQEMIELTGWGLEDFE